MNRLALTLSLALAGLCSLPAAAQQFQKPEDAIKYRKAAFTVTAAHFGRIGAMVQGKAPYDAKAAAEAATLVATMAALPWAGFGPGTDKGETRAKAEVWSNADKYKAAASKYQDEAAKLATAAKAGNLDALKAAFGPAAQTCKGCHEDFRKE